VVLPGATWTAIWEKAGTDIAALLPSSVMHVDDMVDAALVGLDRGETVTMPSLPDIAKWEAYEATRQEMIPKLSRSAPALCYAVTALHPMGARYLSEVINHDRHCFWSPAVMTMAAIALASLAGSTRWCASSGAPRETLAADTRMVQHMTPAAVPLPMAGELPSLDSATAWRNAPPLTAAGLRGNIVLIDFWTYSCINWLRSLPSVRAWAEKYQEHGLVVIGVHTPEFACEHHIENVRHAAQDLRVEYPIAIDNGQALWRAFKTQYWPALSVIDAQGHMRHHHFGEGAYAQSGVAGVITVMPSMT